MVGSRSEILAMKSHAKHYPAHSLAKELNSNYVGVFFMQSVTVKKSLLHYSQLGS